MNYQRIYDQIIERARRESRGKGEGVYYEAHHIVPKCLGGGGSVYQWKTHSNITLLTAKEHFICHRLLCKIHPGTQKLVYAYWALCNLKNKWQAGRYAPSSRAYAEAKQLNALEASVRIGSQNPMYGRKHSSATIQKMVKARTGLKKTEAAKNKVRGANHPRWGQSYPEQSRRQSKQLLHLPTGTVYGSRRFAASALNRSEVYITRLIKRGECKYL